MWRQIPVGLLVMMCGLTFTETAQTAKKKSAAKRVKAVDYEKRLLTITVGEEDQTFRVHKDAKVTKGIFNKEDKKIDEVPAEFADIQAGFVVMAMTVGKEGNNEVITAVKFFGQIKK